MPIVNKQVKFLTSQYIGTCKSAYTKGLRPKLSTNFISTFNHFYYGRFKSNI